MRLAVAALAVALLVSAAPAGAAEIWRTPTIDDGPFASGDGVGWAEAATSGSEGEMDREESYVETLYLVGPGGTPVPVSFAARIRTPTFSRYDVRVAVEGDFAIETSTTSSGVIGFEGDAQSTRSVRVYDLLRKRAVPDVCWVYAAGGSVLAFHRCTGGDVVRDAATGIEAKAPALVAPRAVAGRFLAGRRDDGSVHVYDWTTGTERYAAQLPAGLLAIAADGTVVANADGSGCAGQPLVVVTVAVPAPRPLPLTACSGWLAISGSQLVMRTPRVYAVAALDGSGTRDVAASAFERGTAHVNGDGLAYAVKTCDGGVSIHRVSLAEPEREAAADVACVGTVTRARLTARHVRVSLTCAAGCAATLRVRPPGHASLASRTVTVAGGTRTFAFRVGRVTRRRLAHSGRALVTLTTSALDGTASTTTRTLRLR